MDMLNNQISFQSRIKLVSVEDFNKKVKHLNPKKHYVGYPWTPDTMKKGKDLYTDEIMDCIAGGIVDGKNNVTMFHLCTRSYAQAKRTRQKGFDIKNIERRMLEKIDLTSKKLHAFIIGGFKLEEKSKYNSNKINQIKKVFEKYQIPYTDLTARKDVHYFGRHSIFYENKTDTWYIANSLATPPYKGREPEIVVKDNSVVHNVYEKVRDSRGLVSYPVVRKETNTEDFFKSQFRNVSLCKYDEWA